MTVQAQDSVQYYDGPINVGAVISITDFTFIDNSHVSLKIRGIDEIWEYGTDYTVDGADTLTRTVTLNRAVEAGQVLAAYLDVPITQNISPEEGGNFPASTNEFVLDKLTYICQMLYERITRALQVSVDTPFNGTLPDPKGKANRIIALNSTGTGLAYSTYDVSELEYIANRLYASIANVDITANNIEDVITTAANILSINTVADSVQSVITTAESITNVNIVGDDLALGVDSAINKVNANKENIDINAANIEDIQNAEENAQTCIDKALEAAASANRANTNANNATIWAEGTDEQVETLGGQHSAKGWADVAAQGQIQTDWEQEDATKKDYLKNKPNLHTGYFPGVHVGLADNLYDASAPVDISSFWFRTSAGAESITTGPATLRALRGNMLNSGYTPRSGNYTASSGITVNNFDLDAFEANNPSTGTYVFQYTKPNWTLNGSTITPGSWGLDVALRSESLNITETGGITASCTNISTFAAAVGGDTGIYTFTFIDYDDTETGIHVGPYWSYNGEEIALTNYALSVTGNPVNGDSITGDYTAPLLTGTITVEYTKEVLGTLIPAAVDYLFATVSMNQYDKNGIGRLTHIIDNATIDSTGAIVSGTGKVACVRAVGGIYSGYVAYSENQYITRIAHIPLVWNNGTAILPAIGDTLLLDDTTQDAELSVALFDPVSWVCVAVTDDSDLSIHPRWSSGQDQDHTYDEYSDNRVEIPKVDKNGVDLPTGLYGMPAIGTVFDEIRFETVNTYTKRIERVANTAANMAMVQAYGTPYLYDSDYIFYVLKDTDIIVYELGDVPDEYTVNDYGTEALVATTPDNMCILNISYGTNLKDKLRTNVLTISQQDLTLAQQEQIRENHNTVCKSGDTMTGRLLIETAVVDDALLLKNIGDNSTASVPSENQLRAFRVINNDGTILGDTRFAHLADGSTQAQLVTRNYITGSPISASFIVTLDSSGKASCSFPNTIRCDGQYVNTGATIVNQVSINGSSALTYTLNLPNDGRLYMVWIMVEAATGAASGDYINVKLGSDIMTSTTVARAQARTAATTSTGATVCIAVGSSHKLYLGRATNWTGKVNLFMIGYRRIGTNS